MQLANGDILVAEGYNLMKALGVARDAEPEQTTVAGADLTHYCACRLEIGGTPTASRQPNSDSQEASQSTQASSATAMR